MQTRLGWVYLFHGLKKSALRRLGKNIYKGLPGLLIINSGQMVVTGVKLFRTRRHGAPVFLLKSTQILSDRCKTLFVFVCWRICATRRMLHVLPHMRFGHALGGSYLPRDANASRASHVIISHYCSLTSYFPRSSAGFWRAPEHLVAHSYVHPSYRPNSHTLRHILNHLLCTPFPSPWSINSLPLQWLSTLLRGNPFSSPRLIPAW